MKREKYDETMTSRVSLHPFLAGMNRAPLALLTDCAVSVRFEAGDILLKRERASRPTLPDRDRQGGPGGLSSSRKCGGHRYNRRGRSARLVLDYPPYSWQFTARAVMRTRAIFFEGHVLRQYCERDPSLGYELLKRITAVMTHRLQSARRTMIGLHSGALRLPPVVLESPFMDQELDVLNTPEEVGSFREGAD